MLNIEVWEARTYVKQSDGEDYEFQDDISLGNFRVAALPAAGERIVITAYGAPDYGEGSRRTSTSFKRFGMLPAISIRRGAR